MIAWWIEWLVIGLVDCAVIGCIAAELASGWSSRGNSSPNGSSPPRLIALLGLLGFIGAFVPPAGVGWGVSDALEYTAAANQWLHSGHYALSFNGELVPPRYPPWFSLFVLAPAMACLPSDPSAAALSIALFSGIATAIAGVIGARLGGARGALAAGLLPLALSGYRHFASLPMTEVPEIALCLVGTLCYLRASQAERISPLTALRIGTVITAAAALRPTGAALFLPFLLLFAIKRQPVRSVAALIAPCLPLVIASLGYNFSITGSPFRGGYHLWLSIPYDYPSLTFGWSYIQHNGSAAASTLFLLALVLASPLDKALNDCGIPGIADPADLSAVRRFSVLWCLPHVGFYLIYFYSTERFYLPPMVVLGSVLAGRLFGAQGTPRLIQRSSIILLALSIALCAGKFLAAPPAIRTSLASLRSQLPLTATVITNLNPLFGELFVRRSPDQVFIPIDRSVEYASKLLMYERVDRALNGVNPLDARHPALLESPSRKEVFPIVGIDLSVNAAESPPANTYLFVTDDPTQLPQKAERYLPSLSKLGQLDNSIQRDRLILLDLTQ